MSLIILFASILIEGETKNLSYKPALFKTYSECKSYLSKENDLVLITGSLYLSGEFLNLN